jgi:hypothetical protein
LASIHLLCPVATAARGSNAQPLDPRIHVINNSRVSEDELQRILDKVDIVQIPGDARLAGFAIEPARSQDRQTDEKAGRARRIQQPAKTAWLSASNILTGALRYLDVRSCQSWQALRSDGVLVVGEGVRPLFQRLNRNIHVGTASWINVANIRLHQDDARSDALRICIASRLEKMKGVPVGLEAVKPEIETESDHGGRWPGKRLDRAPGR